MYLAYIDESGDAGFENSPTRFFVLACMLVHESVWKATLDKLIQTRRLMKAYYGVPMRAEVKATDLVYGRRSLHGIKKATRQHIYGGLLDLVRTQFDTHSFAVAIDKEKITNRAVNEPRKVAWQYLFQRLDRFCDSTETHENVLVLPDSGHEKLVKSLSRQVRRFQRIKGFYGGSQEIPARYIIEDPFNKDSSESYFIQMVDWQVYAAHRYREVDPKPRRIPSDFWDRLGDKRVLKVNRLVGGPPGIVLWPR